MAKNSGKAFELAIRKSFDAHGWWCLRITDNVYATGASVKTPADFIAVSPPYYDDTYDYEENYTGRGKVPGVAFLVECKSTEQTSLPLSNITSFQRESLERFDGFGEGILIVLFKKSKKCYAISSCVAFNHCAIEKRKSLSEEICEKYGVPLRKDGATYDLDRLESRYSN